MLDEPDVRRILEECDMSDIDEMVSETRIIFPGAEGIGCFPTSILDHCVCVHAAVLPSARGKKAVAAGNAVCDWLVRQYAMPVLTKIAIGNRPARVFAVLCGGKLISRNETYTYYRLR